MTDFGAHKTNLWREAWAACKQNLRAFMPPMLGIGMLLIICNFYYMPDEVHKVMEQIQAIDAGAGMPQHITPPVARMAHACATIIHLIGFYYFSVLYLRRAPIGVKPELGTESFFAWLGQMALSALCILGVAAVALAICGLVGAGAVYFLHADEKILAAVASVVTMLALVFGGGKFITAGPLALVPVSSAFKASWRLSKGNWWRLVWHYLMLISVVWMWLIVVFLIPAIVILMMVPVAADSPLLIGLLSVVFGLSGVSVLAGGSIYCCVAARVLTREQGLPSPRESV